jgi:hypothetical protein
MVTPAEHPSVTYEFNPEDYGTPTDEPNTNAGSRVTPEQALYAYKQALAYRNTFSNRHSEPPKADDRPVSVLMAERDKRIAELDEARGWKGQPSATVSDSRRFEASRDCGDLSRGFGGNKSKHSFIRSDGTPIYPLKKPEIPVDSHENLNATAW